MPCPSYALARGLMYLTLDRSAEAVFTTFSFTSLPNPITEMWQYMCGMLYHALMAVVALVIIELVRAKSSW